MRLLPQSLVGRVFALYSLSLFLFLGAGLSLFLFDQFGRRLDESFGNAEALARVLMPALSESVVIGDYDSISTTLDKAAANSDFVEVSFIDLKGGVVRGLHDEESDDWAPAALQQRVAERLYDINQPIVIGGKDYGVLRIRFSALRIAAQLWQKAVYALGLGLGSLVVGLLLIYWPLRYWLGSLDRLGHFESQIREGSMQAEQVLSVDAPLEIRRTFEVLDRAARSLQVQRERAAVTLSAIVEGVVTLDAEGHVLLANPTALQLLRCDEGEAIGRPLWEMTPQLFEQPGDLRPWQNRRSQWVAQDGRALVIETSLLVIRDPEGQAVAHVLTGRDVTEQHELDQRLRTELSMREQAMTSLRGLLEGLSQRWQGGSVVAGADDIAAISGLIAGLVERMQERSDQLDAIFSLSPDGFVSFDGAGRARYISPAFTSICGIAAHQVLGQDAATLFDRLAQQCAAGVGTHALERWLQDAPREADAGALTLELARPTRRVVTLALQRGQSQAISQVLHLRDVTHESEVDQMKSEFVSTAAHELRTPMASIFGFTELMMMREMSPERRKEMLALVYRQSQAMILILDELLDLARIEARRGKDFVLETLDLGEVVAATVREFNPPAGREPPVIEADGLPHGVHADRQKLQQVLRNLLSNAYKYSPDGGEVTARLLSRPRPGGEPGAPRQWGVQVEDRGIGMTPEQLARVCERFYRADASGAIPGTGLGMSIVKEIVELLGGELELASEPGVGTRATAWLPDAGHLAASAETAEAVA